MTEHVEHLLMPNDPAAKAAVLQRNLRNGWAAVPGMSDHELGAQMRATHPKAPLYAPPLPGPPARTEAAPGNWAAFWVAALGGIVLCIVGICALVPR